MPQAEEQALDLLVVGELNADLILEKVGALPALEEEQLAEGMALALGGSSAILAANAAALGLHVGFVGRLGRDLFGDFVRKRLAARGVDTRHVIEAPDGATGVTVIYTHGAQRGMLTYPGVMADLVAEDVPEAVLARARHVHVSSFYLQPGLRPGCAALFERARARGLSTSLDTNWDPSGTWGGGVWDVLAHTDVFLPNDEEARRIAGDDDLDAAMHRLAEVAGAVVVTCGAEGARARRRGETWALPAVPVELADAVGAGDSFNAGFLRAHLAGQPMAACLQGGLQAGAFSTTAAGGTAAFDDADAFSRFAARHEPNAAYV